MPDYLEKYRQCGSVRQLILVEYKGGSEAALELWEKNGESFWEQSLSCHAFVGKAGVGRAAENDTKTPLGDFGMVCGFGIKPDPGAKLPYVAVDEHTWCCGDSMAYNRIIDLRDLPHDCRGEHMADFSPEYNYGLFFDYNSEGTAGRGFAIFVHCKGENPYTGGCIAVDEEAMIMLLQAMDSNARICVYENPEK